MWRAIEAFDACAIAVALAAAVRTAMLARWAKSKLQFRPPDNHGLLRCTRRYGKKMRLTR